MDQKKNLNFKEIFNLALENHKKNNYEIAEKLYSDCIKKNPNYFDAHNNLGVLYNQLGEFQKAKNCYEKTIKINSADPSAYNNLGFVLNQLGDFEKSKKCYEKAIQINPNYFEAYNNFGNTLKELAQYQGAINCYQKAIQINPNYVGAYNNLGNILQELGKYQDAMKFYEKAIQINPNYVDAYNNLGNIFKELGEYRRAVNCYEKVMKINPNHLDVNINLGNIFKELGKYQSAIEYYDKAIQIQPNNITSHWLSMNNFPIIYKNLEEQNFSRKKFEKSIEKINQLLDSEIQYSKKQLLNSISSSTNFYLHYQGKDDLELQKKYASLIEKITKKIYQKVFRDIKKNNPSELIRVGFVSSFFRNHTVSKLFKNWVVELDNKKFEKFVYYVGTKLDDVSNTIKEKADYFFNHIDVDKIIDQILKDNLDVLIYLDIGMAPKIQILSSLRLAPIQCNAWGHPVTSGFKNIDYFFSGESMETENSQKYYSEKLINFPGLGIKYDFPNLKEIKKPKIQNKSNSIIFLNLQSLFKLLPQDDHVYLDIIKIYPNSYFWFISGKNESVTKIFKERIFNLFQKEGYDYEKYFYFHPKCNQNEFFGLVEQSDIILDSLNWSGGNTSLEAISLNKPIVTCPSDFMRGRHTCGILKILEIEDTIANSKEEYVKISVKLASNNDFRNFIINKIKSNKKKLFSNDKPIKFLEDFITKNVSLKHNA